MEHYNPTFNCTKTLNFQLFNYKYTLVQVSQNSKKSNESNQVTIGI